MAIEYEVVFLPGVRNGKHAGKPIRYHIKYTHLISSLCGKHPVSHNFKDAPGVDATCPECLKALEHRKKSLNLHRKSVYVEQP